MVLAGGKSRRMGQDKALLQFRNKALIEYSLELLSSNCEKVFISSNSIPYETYNFPIVHDIQSDSGPMGGLQAVLEEMKTENLLVLSCDTPFINQVVIDRLLSLHKPNVISYCETSSRRHPLIGIYPKSSLNQIKEKLCKKEYKILDLLTVHPSQSIFFEDEYEDLFVNLNDPKDIEQWK